MSWSFVMLILRVRLGDRAGLVAHVRSRRSSLGCKWNIGPMVVGRWTIGASERWIESTGAARLVVEGLGRIRRAILAVRGVEAPALAVSSPHSLVKLHAASDG